MSLERIREEYKDLNNNPNANLGLLVGLEKEDNYKDWKVNMVAPKDSIYRKGIFLSYRYLF